MKNNQNPDYKALAELETMKNARNYNKWIWEEIRPEVGAKALEIGAGIGTFTEFLKEEREVTATDIGENCLEILRNKYRKSTNIKIEYLDITSINNPAIRETQFDSVIALNVIEHISDDIKALKNIDGLLKPGGKAIIMVPAFQFAYGTIDKLDGHYRRYRKNELVNKMNEAGFTAIKAKYFNSIGLLAWYYTNKIARNSSTSRTKVKIYDSSVVPFISKAERLITPPFGQSVIAIGEKR